MHFAFVEITKEYGIQWQSLMRPTVPTTIWSRLMFSLGVKADLIDNKHRDKHWRPILRVKSCKKCASATLGLP